MNINPCLAPGCSTGVVRRRMVMLLVGAAIGAITPLAQAQQTQVPNLSASLTVEQGVRVLRLWGSPRDQGFGHGYLLGDDIVALVQNVLLDPRIMPDPQMYEMKIRRGLLKRFVFTPAQREELEGMLDGVRQKVGAEGTMLARLNRPLDIDDLIAINTLADWNPSACTSFAVWGPFTSDGGTVVARNLDYFDLPGLREAQLLVVRTQRDPNTRRTVSVGWPALIGMYTAINEDGVFVAMHDVPAGAARTPARLTPRSLALRHLVEKARLPEPALSALQYLKNTPTLRGNNFLLAAPFQSQSMPAVVFEYDSDETKDGGVTMRQPLSPLSGTPRNSIACTNHYRIRAARTACNRYAAIVEGLNRLSSQNTRIDEAQAFEIISTAAVSGTIHTVVASLNKKTFDLWLAPTGGNAQQGTRLRFALEELWKK